MQTQPTVVNKIIEQLTHPSNLVATYSPVGSSAGSIAAITAQLVKAGNHVAIDLQDRDLCTAITEELALLGYADYICNESTDLIATTLLNKWRAVYKAKSLTQHISGRAITSYDRSLQRTINNLQQIYEPVFGKQSWWQLCRIADQMTPQQLLPIRNCELDLVGSTEEFWHLKSSIDRCANLWSEDYLVLHKMNIWHPDLQANTAETYQSLSHYRKKLHQSLQDLLAYESELQQSFAKDRRLKYIALQQILDEIIITSDGNTELPSVADQSIVVRYQEITSQSIPDSISTIDLVQSIETTLLSWSADSHSLLQAKLKRANKLNGKSDQLQLLDRQLTDIYEALNSNKILRREVHNSAHYLRAQMDHAQEVIASLDMALHILDNQTGYLLWLRTLKTLPEAHQAIVQSLLIYSSDQWTTLAEEWYVKQLIQLHHPTKPAISLKEIAGLYSKHLLAEQSIQDSWKIIREHALREQLRSLKKQNKDLFRQIIKAPADDSNLTIRDIRNGDRDLYDLFFPIRMSCDNHNLTDVLITDNIDHSHPRRLVITNDPSPYTLPPNLSVHTTIKELSVRNRLEIGKALAYHIDQYAVNLRLFVLKNQYVISLLDDIDNREILRKIRSSYVKEVALKGQEQNILTDHLIAVEIPTTIWIPSPVLQPTATDSLLHQYQVINTLQIAGIRVMNRTECFALGSDLPAESTVATATIDIQTA